MPSRPRTSRPRLAPRIISAATIFICLATTVPSSAGATLDSRTAASGLKEALGVGTSRSVDLLGRPDGYLKNVDVRIPMPRSSMSSTRASGRSARGTWSTNS